MTTTTTTSKVLNIARAIAAESPLAALGASLTYAPEFNLESLGTSAVCLVAPGNITLEKGTHGAPLEPRVTIEIAIFKRIPVSGSDMISAVEALAVTRENILQYFAVNRRPDDYDDAYIMEIESPALYDPDLLRQLGIFYTLITLTVADWSA